LNFNWVWISTTTRQR